MSTLLVMYQAVSEYFISPVSGCEYSVSTV